MSEPEIYRTHLSLPQPDGSIHQALGGAFMIHNGNLHHLASYYDHQQMNAIPAGPVGPQTMEALAAPPAGMRIVSRKGLGNGDHLDMVPEHPLGQPYTPPPPAAEPAATVAPARPPSVFHYKREGHDRPHVLEVTNGQYMLDGSPLSEPEVRKIVENVGTGRASLRYRTGETASAVRKAERAFRSLIKNYEADDDEMDPTNAALAYFAARHGDPESEEHLKNLRRQLYEDPMMVGIGNRYAWDKFHKKAMPGVYGSLDLNDLKGTNDTLGHEAGHSMIRAFGQAARDAANEAAPGHIKLFRVGGDEVNMHATTPEHAYNFMRTLRSKLDAVPAVNGTHRVSVSAGLGNDIETADKALYDAKARKMSPEGVRLHPVGQTPHFINSRLPGSEGPVPHDTAVQLPLKQLPPDALPPPPAPPTAPAPTPSTPAAPATQPKK